jgi:hypothetical protein
VASLSVFATFFIAIGSAGARLDRKVDVEDFRAFVAQTQEKLNLQKQIETISQTAQENHDAVLQMEITIREVLKEEGLLQ